MKQLKEKLPSIFLALYLVVFILIFFYSFTQVDLSITPIRDAALHKLQVFLLPITLFDHEIRSVFSSVNTFLRIGYFDRPASTYFYGLLLFLLYGFYGVLLFLVHKKKFDRKYIWRLILGMTVVLAFSYNAFSYDLFNYIFDAKIVTFYHQNPYLQKALDYPHDPMLTFMHWTHRTYPYGPFWLVLTVPLSFISVNNFLVAMILFKSLIAACFIGTIYFIGKILKKIQPDQELFGIVFFAFNPLVLIESIVSAHNDIVMLFFAVWAFYLLIQKQYIFSLVALVLSIGIKFATGLLLPAFIFYLFLSQKKKEKYLPFLIFSSIILMAIGVVIATVRTNFQPWYIVYAMPFAALVGRKYVLLIPSFVVTFFALLNYVPFFFLGNWDKPVPTILQWLNIAGLVLSGILILFMALYKKQSTRIAGLHTKKRSI